MSGITNVDTSGLLLGGNKFRDELFTAAGAGTILAGTILARKRVLDAVVVAAKAGGNTGTGTCTVASVIEGTSIPKIGAHTITCIVAVANGGIFQHTDPDGQVISSYLPMTAGAGAATAFKSGGLGFTLTDNGDFIVGDAFTITVAVSNKLVVFAIAGAGGAQVPVAVLPYPVVAAGAGDIPVRALEFGDVRKSKLIIAADGTGANITNAILDTLRSFGIVAVDVTELNIADNQ